MTALWYNFSINKCTRDAQTSGYVTKTRGGVLMDEIVTQSPNCGIYKITNTINGMVYIGQSRRINLRFKEHKSGERKQHNYFIHNAIDKYGVENFSFEIIEVCQIDQLNMLEIKYIAEYNSLKPNGYNLELGGNANKVVSDETKSKMSLSKRGEKHNFYGTRRSDTTKQRISLGNSEPVNQYTESGVYIQTFPSQNAVMLATGRASHISDCCKGKRRLACGYQWRYADQGNKDIDPARNKAYNVSQSHKTILAFLREKPVSQFTKDGVYIATFDSAKKAGLATGTNWKVISACRTGKKKAAGGFVWRYAK